MRRHSTGSKQVIERTGNSTLTSWPFHYPPKTDLPLFHPPTHPPHLPLFALPPNPSNVYPSRTLSIPSSASSYNPSSFIPSLYHLPFHTSPQRWRERKKEKEREREREREREKKKKKTGYMYVGLFIKLFVVSNVCFPLKCQRKSTIQIFIIYHRGREQ